MKIKIELILVFVFFLILSGAACFYYMICAALGHGLPNSVLISQCLLSILAIDALPIGLIILFRMWKFGDTAKRKKTIIITILFLMLLAVSGYALWIMTGDRWP